MATNTLFSGVFCVLRNASFILTSATVLLSSTTARAADCEAFLKSFLDSDPYLSSVYVTMVTLNNRNTASYTETRLYYLPPVQVGGVYTRRGRFVTLKAGQAGIDQPKFDFGLAVQVFSDRLTANQQLIGSHVGLPRHGRQKFDEAQADSLAFEITVAPTPRVTIRLRNWGDVRAAFDARCDDGGFVLGSTPEVKYILRLEKWGIQ